ncbi:NAD(P)H-binding protein [Pseudonocardia sp. KRD291]|uniref:NmrA family NAD(P)-binding protein n=1 Tax=Pseudonocardia sp. KRD291 TaxID=2792007 RepID=UPI001C4A1C0C|nr:NAD(P)H-binding protein [Pseudonocardia sp. KRD291]MBW0101760.1 NAD(P)H-binding protein [Pseudonocardia sp. KRD291]
MTTTTPTVLVTGATGTVGTSLVPALRSRGVDVRAMTRSPERTVPDATNVVADLHDPDALTAALTGVDAVFLNSPSAADAAELQIRFADLARRAGVTRLVLLSQYAARAESPVRFLRWHAEVEAHAATLGIDVTVLRPNLFMQGTLAFAATTAAHDWFGAPIGDAAISLVDTRDIADAAATVLTEPGHAGRTYTLTGPDALTHHDLARALSVATAREIAFTEVPAEQFAAMASGLLPPWQLDGFLEDYAHYARGEAAEVHSSVPDLTGRPARGFRAFAHDHAAAFAVDPALR